MWWVCSNNGAICNRPLMSETQINLQIQLFCSYCPKRLLTPLTVIEQKKKKKKIQKSLLNLDYEHTASKVLCFSLNPALFCDSTTHVTKHGATPAIPTRAPGLPGTPPPTLNLHISQHSVVLVWKRRISPQKTNFCTVRRDDIDS